MIRIHSSFHKCLTMYYMNIMNNIPNLPASEVPHGSGESMNQLVKTYGEPKIIKDVKNHVELGKALGMMDFKQTAQFSGGRFVTLKGQLAKLERAIINFMIDTHIEQHGYVEISPPTLVRPEAMYNVGQLPKFKTESYSVNEESLRLIPSGEVPLTNLVANTICGEEHLPQRYVAYTECFRSEAGSAGRDTKGMFRNHQFGKVELVSITTHEESNIEHQHMLYSAERILQLLELPYRVMILCTGDMGFSAKKTYDLEVWFSGQNKYREISSISNCGDFQARRMKARYKNYLDKKTQFVHTLNGSGLAVGRTIIALLEHYQNQDGSITIPSVLVKYMGGKTIIKNGAN